MKVAPGSVIPAYLHPGRAESNFLQSLDDMLLWDQQHEGRVLWPPIRNECGIDLSKGRDEATHAFLTMTPAEWLLMVDADMGFAPDTAERLLAAADPTERPIVGALCFGMKRAEVTAEKGGHFNLFPTIYAWVDRGDEVGFAAHHDYPKDSLIQVDGTGAACLLIHRSVLEAIGERWWQPVTHPDTNTRFSEDLSFCVRAAQVGAPVHVHTGVRTSHKKSLYLDEWAFDNWPKIKPPMPKAVVAGSGRCGTQFVSGVMQALAIKASHELLFTPEGYDYKPGCDVAVSWLAVPELDELDDDAQVVHMTRDPLAVVNSLVGIGFFDPEGEDEHGRYVRFVRRHLPDLPDDPTLAAMRFVVEWNRRIEPYATERVSVEDFPWGRVLKRLGHRRTKQQIADAVAKVGSGVNHRDRAGLTWSTLPEGPERDDLAQLAKDYGYEVEL